MIKKCKHCIKWYLEGEDFCENCGQRLTPEQKTEEPAPVSEPEYEESLVEQSTDFQPGVDLSVGRAGNLERKVYVTGADRVNAKVDRVGLDSSEYHIDVNGEKQQVISGDTPRAGNRKSQWLGQKIQESVKAGTGAQFNMGTERVGWDQSTKIVNYSPTTNIVIRPDAIDALELYDDPDEENKSVGPVERVFVATRVNVLSFKPLGKSGRLVLDQNYAFKERFKSIRSLTPLNVNGILLLLVGMQQRVGLWQPLMEDESELGFYRGTKLGAAGTAFNSVTVSNGKIYASHSQYGLVRWDMTRADDPERVHLSNNRRSNPRQGECVRGVKLADDDTIFVIHGRQIVNLVDNGTPVIMDRYGLPEFDVRRCGYMDKDYLKHPRSKPCHQDIPCNNCLGSGISGLADFVVLENAIFAVSENGIVIRWDRGSPRSGRVVRNMGGHCLSLDTTRIFGRQHLVLGSLFGVHLFPVEPGKPEYFYSYSSGMVNEAFVASDMVIATADHLKTLLVWNTRKPGSEPSQVIHLSKQHGHRGQSFFVLSPKF